MSGCDRSSINVQAHANGRHKQTPLPTRPTQQSHAHRTDMEECAQFCHPRQCQEPTQVPSRDRYHAEDNQGHSTDHKVYHGTTKECGRSQNCACFWEVGLGRLGKAWEVSVSPGQRRQGAAPHRTGSGRPKIWVLADLGLVRPFLDCRRLLSQDPPGPSLLCEQLCSSCC